MEFSAPARHNALIGRFLADTCGATAIEYSMIAAGVGLAVASAVWALGSQVQTTLYAKLANLF
jgi:Flp pilus assembly pilin Flp